MALFNFVELKPCPFCGEKPEDWRTREAIVCMRCGYQLNR